MLTPLLALPRFCPEGRLYAKPEMLCPTGSAKFRSAKAMLDDALRTGALPPGGTVLDASSGNMGIALAALCAQRGLSCTIVMPDATSLQRKALIRAYGANLILTDGGMPEAVEYCARFAQNTPHFFYVRQFENEANVQGHFQSTGPEIYAQCPQIRIFVAGVGTGGTITGTGRYLKSRDPTISLVAVEPISAGEIPGIGAGFVPPILDMSILDTIVAVSAKDALQTRDLLARTEGIYAGPSSGASLYVAKQIAQLPENRDKAVVVLLPDSGERYFTG